MSNNVSARQDGYSAYCNGKASSQCHYCGAERDEWLAGYASAAEEDEEAALNEINNS